MQARDDHSGEPDSPSPLLYTIRATTNALSIGRTKLYQLLGSGELESVYIDGARRVPADAIAEFIKRLRRRDDEDED